MATKQRRQKRKPDTLPAKFKAGFLDKLDQRTQIARVIKERIHAMHDDLGGDPSYSQRFLCEQLAHVEALLALSNQRIRAGEPFDLKGYTNLQNVASGIIGKLANRDGLKRHAKPVKRLSELVLDQAK